ncbi:unnamed protein product [Scytosiphon promiscuus]
MASCLSSAMRSSSALAADLSRRRVQHMLRAAVATTSCGRTLSSETRQRPSSESATPRDPVPDPRDQRVLHAAVAGLPNAGKSTLLNYLVGDKVSAVSTKRHTTRENTLGVMTVGRTQVFFHDTPGFVSHEDRDDYKPALSAASREAIASVNLTLLLVDASKDITKRGLQSLMGLLERALRSRCELFLVLNKSDLVQPRHRLLDTTDEIMDRAQEIMDRIDKEREDADANIAAAKANTPRPHVDSTSAAAAASASGSGSGGDSGTSSSSSSSSSGSSGSSMEGRRQLFREGGKTVDDHITVFMISAKNGHGVKDIVDFLVHRARPGPWLFGRDETTNKDKRSRANEIVREGLYKHLYKELPYQITTHVRALYQRPDGSVSLSQELRLERSSQKPIVLGKLRFIKKDVEWDLRKLFGARVDVRFLVAVGQKKG